MGFFFPLDGNSPITYIYADGGAPMLRAVMCCVLRPFAFCPSLAPLWGPLSLSRSWALETGGPM